MTRISFFCKTLVAAAAFLGFSASASAQTSPPLLIPVATLDAARQCTTSPGLAGDTKTPILLVHGTATSDASWSAGYWKVLPTKGYPVCKVTLPDQAMGDIQNSVEYVVQAVRTMYASSGRKVSLIGHSQGGLIVGWAMKFWPDLAFKVDDAIGLSGAFHGSADLAACMAGNSCGAAVWQLRSSSNLVAAFNRKPLPAGPSFTSILTLTDVVVTPQPGGSTLDGGTNLAVQTKCPGRVVTHVGMLMDAHAYDIVMDALTHTGPASLSRVSVGSCLGTYMAGADLVKWNQFMTGGLLETFMTFINQPNPVASEPPVRSYAQ